MGIGDWGLGVGGWGWGATPTAPTPKSPIPNPQSPIPSNYEFKKNFNLLFINKIIYFNIILNKNKLIK